jgi:hypothetical protein
VQSAGAAVEATGVTAGAAALAGVAGVTRGGVAARATAGAGRVAGATAWRTAGRAGAGIAATSASAGGVGRSIHAVVSPVLSAVTPMMPRPMVASFHGFVMARPPPADVTAAPGGLFGLW